MLRSFSIGLWVALAASIGLADEPLEESQAVEATTALGGRIQRADGKPNSLVIAVHFAVNFQRDQQING